MGTDAAAEDGQCIMMSFSLARCRGSSGIAMRKVSAARRRGGGEMQGRRSSAGPCRALHGGLLLVKEAPHIPEDRRLLFVITAAVAGWLLRLVLRAGSRYRRRPSSSAGRRAPRVHVRAACRGRSNSFSYTPHRNENRVSLMLRACLLIRVSGNEPVFSSSRVFLRAIRRAVLVRVDESSRRGNGLRMLKIIEEIRGDLLHPRRAVRAARRRGYRLARRFDARVVGDGLHCRSSSDELCLHPPNNPQELRVCGGGRWPGRHRSSRPR